MDDDTIREPGYPAISRKSLRSATKRVVAGADPTHAAAATPRKPSRLERQHAEAEGREDYAERRTPMLEAENERLRALLGEARAGLSAFVEARRGGSVASVRVLTTGAVVLAKIDAEMPTPQAIQPDLTPTRQ